jgi:beta-galactosidase
MKEHEAARGMPGPAPISFTPRSYVVDGRPFYLSSGEFHYFRVPRADWKRRMRLFKETGGNTLATYVPWMLHEPAEGRFAWHGEHLELEAFLETAAAEGLYVIARPGPYQYSELVNDGLPEWLLAGYPRILARTLPGRAFRHASVSYVHSLFWEKVRRWFDEACPLIARYTVHRGGPVAFVQIDNEMAGMHEWFGSLDYNPESMGFGDPNGRYAAWLRRRFADVAGMNGRYGTRFASFADALPPAEALDIPSLRARQDYFAFYLSTIAEYASFLAGLIRGHGITEPLVHNAANPGMNAYFLETGAALGSEFLLGSDHYYNLDQTWEQNHPTPQYAASVLVSLETLRLMGYPPTVFELPGGSCSDWPPITPTDALACAMTNLAFGMRGHNYYIFTGGPNPPGAGSTTDVYDYNAGIGADGEIRPLYEAQKTFGRIVENRPWLMAAERLTDFDIGVELEHSRCKPWPALPGPRTVSPPEAWRLMRLGPLTTGLCAGLSPRLVRLGARGAAPAADAAPSRAPLVVVCSASMAANAQSAVVEHISAGGSALLLPVLPSMDDDLLPCTILADFLGSPRSSPPDGGFPRCTLAGVSNVRGELFSTWEGPPPGAETVGVEERSGRVTAWRRRFPGGGAAIVCGLSWIHSMREHERMLAALLGSLGCSPVLRCSNPNVWATVWTADRKATLFLLNLFTAPMEATVSVTLPGERTIDAGAHTLAPVTVKVVDLEI